MDRNFLEEAKGLHEKYFVADVHYDLLPLVWVRRQRGERKVIENHYIPSFKEGGVDLVVSSLFISDEYLPEMALRRALDYISALYQDMEESPGLFALCRNTDEIKRARSSGMVALLLSFEGAEPLGNDINLLRIFYELGVRGLGIVWSRRNYAADGCHFEAKEEGQKGGLTNFGVQLLREAERLGMYVDVSHLNDEGLDDVFKFSNKPLLASHSNCRKLVPSMRNLTDEQIIEIAKRGGVIGMNAYSKFVKHDSENIKVKDLADHVYHIYDLVKSCKNICYGFDFCDEIHQLSGSESKGYDSIKGHSRCFELTAELIARGIDEKEIAGIMGENFLRFLEVTIG